MKKLSLTLLTCLLLLAPNVVLSETMDDLVVRDGLYYKKSSDIPFSGEITGLSPLEMTGLYSLPVGRVSPYHQLSSGCQSTRATPPSHSST